MSFTDDLKAALGGAVSDAVGSVLASARGAITPARIGTILDPIAKTGLDWVMASTEEPTPIAPVAGIRPGVYSAKTPPPGSGINAPAVNQPQGVPPVVILAGVALTGVALWHFTKGAAK